MKQKTPIQLTRIYIKEAAKVFSRCEETLRRWDASGKLVANRDEKNNRYYTKDQIDSFKRDNKDLFAF